MVIETMFSAFTRNVGHGETPGRALRTLHIRDAIPERFCAFLVNAGPNRSFAKTD